MTNILVLFQVFLHLLLKIWLFLKDLIHRFDILTDTIFRNQRIKVLVIIMKNLGLQAPFVLAASEWLQLLSLVDLENLVGENVAENCGEHLDYDFYVKVVDYFGFGLVVDGGFYDVFYNFTNVKIT